MSPDRCTEAREIALTAAGISAADVAREASEGHESGAYSFVFYSDEIGSVEIARVLVTASDVGEVL